jgi:hypothetical protein
MKRPIKLLSLLALLAAAAASCATAGGRDAEGPPAARVTVVNFLSATGVGMTTEIDFSIANLTDGELRDLTLRVEANPENGVDLPFTERVIDRIPPHGSWTPDEPFLVRGRQPGETAILFVVTRDGVILAKDYVLVDVAPVQ